MTPDERAVRFISNLTLTGDYSGSPFRLRPWQETIVRQLYGTLRPDQTRQYHKAFIFLGRKQAKTELASALGLYHLFADSPGQSIVSAASDQKQAALIFERMAQMIRADKFLCSQVRILDATKKIIHKTRESTYQALSAEGEAKLGLNPSVVIIDELCALAPDRHEKLYSALTTAQGARKNPLLIIITTAGQFDPTSLLYREFTYAKNVRDGITEDPSYLPVLYYADQGDDWTNEENWRKAMPALGDFCSAEFIREQFTRAKVDPSAEVAFRTLFLNQFVDNLTSYIPLSVWDECGEAPLPRGVCWGGLDLSSTVDLSAFVLLFGDGSILPFLFAPEEACKQRDRANKTRIDAWVRQGYIQTTPGNVIDYEVIRRKIVQLNEQFEIREIAVDRWNSTQLVTQLQGDGLNMVGFGQGFASMNAPTKELLTLALDRKLKHGGNPVLRWMTGNMTVETDPAGNVKPNKGKSADKIDGLCALIMALGRRMLEPPVSVYDDGASLFF